MPEPFEKAVCSALWQYSGRRVHTISGVVLGRVVDVLGDAHSGAPQWVIIRVWGPRWSHRAAPIGLCLESLGRIVLPTSRRGLCAGPSIRPGVALTAQEELNLRAYWSAR